MNKPRTPWYRMDNASFMYSSIQREEFSAIYRFSAVMAEDVDPALLQAAVDRTLPRFPGFAMKICRGFFWYYFEPNTAPGIMLKIVSPTPANGPISAVFIEDATSIPAPFSCISSSIATFIPTMISPMAGVVLKKTECACSAFFFSAGWSPYSFSISGSMVVK